MTELVMTGASQDECWPLVRDFHYSKRMPSATKHCFAWRKSGGLFGDTGEPQAVVMYGLPINRHWPTDSLELQRLVRSDEFSEKLSSLVSWSLRWLREHTNTPFVLSYADSGEGHHGGIYQASGFYFVGSRESRHIGFTDGKKFIHGRSSNTRYGTRSIPKIAEIRPDWTPVFGQPKHLYIKPIRQRLNAILKKFDWALLPYPKPNNAACLLDESGPPDLSRERTPEAAPNKERAKV